MRFQPTQREAWLVELDDSSPRTEGDLCERHAAALVLPRGWQLHDERLERADADTDADAPAIPKRPKAPRARRSPLRAVPEPQPQLDLETATSEPTPDAAPEPLEVPPIADLDDVFDAHTPLLKRAFENVWPLENDAKE